MRTTSNTSIFIVAVLSIVGSTAYSQCSAPSFGTDASTCSLVSNTPIAARNNSAVDKHRWYAAQTGGSYIMETTPTETMGMYISTVDVSQFITYWVSAVCGGSESSGRTMVRYQQTQPGTINITPSTSPFICQGSSINLTAGGGSSYSWSANPSGNWTGGPGTITATPPSTTDYTLTGTESICNTQVNGYITVTVTPQVGQVGAITGGVNERCKGSGQTTYSSTGATNADSYTWTITQVSGGTSPGSISAGVVTWNSAFSGQATITLRANGCNSSYTDASPRTVTVYDPITALTINAPSGICPSATVQLVLNSTQSHVSYQLYKTGTGAIGSPVQGNGGMRSWDVSTTGTYSITGSNSVCGSAEMANQPTLSALTPNELSVSRNPSGSVCAGTSVTLTASGGTNYSWSNGGSGSQIIVSATATTYTVTGNETTCQTSKQAQNGIGLLTPGNLTADKSPTGLVCPGTQVTLTAGGGSNYSWTANTGGGPWSDSPVNVYPTSTTTYTLSGLESVCNTSKNAQVIVTMEANVTQVSKPSGTASRCQAGGTSNYTASASNATSYSWELITLSTITGSSPGSISSSGVVTWNSSYSGWVAVKAIAHRCSSTTSDTLRVKVKALPAMLATLTKHIVSGTIVSFQPDFVTGDGTTYSWTTAIGSGNGAISGVSPTSGNGTATGGSSFTAFNHQLTSTSTVQRTVTYTYSSTYNGCSSGPTDFVVYVNPLPIVLIGAPYTRPAIALGGLLKLKSNNTYDTYQWRRDGQNISGATGNLIDVVQPGDYDMIVKFFGSSMTDTTTALKISPLGYETDNTANMMITTVVRKAGITPTTNLYTTLQTGEYMQSITYSDDLARPTQDISIGVSPLRRDVVLPYRYDSSVVTSYLPYADTTLDGYRKPTALSSGGSYNSSRQYLFYQNASKVAHSAVPFAKTTVEESPLGRPLEQGAPGASWQPGQHTVKPQFQTNAASDIRKWTTAGPSGYYDANSLLVEVTTDENGYEVRSYSDKAGQTMLKRVQLDETLDLNGTGVNTSYLETYYVFDIRGNLALQVPPKAVALLNNGTSWSSSFRDQWCFIYTYDDRGRLVEKKTPDAAVVYYGYDPLDRLVLTQDANLRSRNKWMAIKYDIKGRPILTGLYYNGTQTTRKALDSLVLRGLYPNSNDKYYEERGSSMEGYTSNSFPTSLDTVLTVNYFDDQDFNSNGTADFVYKTQNLTGEAKVASSFGLATGSKRRKLGADTWLYTYVFHDKFGRIIQTRTNNHLAPDSINNLTTAVYDFEGKVLLTKHYHYAGGTNIQTIVNKTTYDHIGRPLKVYQNINGESRDLLVAQYNYNELGQVIEKNLHLLYDNMEDDPGASNGGDLVLSQYNNQPAVVGRSSVRLLPGFTVIASGSSTFVAKTSAKTSTQAETDGQFLQSIDYRYNIRGWVESINNAQLNSNSVNNDDTGDYFGMELMYDNPESGLSDSARYNGGISALKWRGIGGTGTNGQRSYKFSYDKSDRLKSATFQRYSTTAWDKEVNTQDELQAYDHNGNITSLTRKRNQRGLSGTTITSTAQTIDNLTYTYTTANQLSKVEDAVANSTGTGDFKNVVTTTEYTYTADGQMKKDDNKGIQSITYNILGKPVVITYSGSPTKTVTYTYDAAGNKLRMVTVNGGTTTTTDYVGGFVYENSALSFFSSPEGRVVKSGSNYEYQYAIADHQGNTRVVFSSQTPGPESYAATFENLTNDAAAGFGNIPNSSPYWTTFTAANHTPGGTKVIRMNQGNPVAVTRSMKVYPGDNIDLEVWAYYENNSGYGSSSPTLNTMIGIIAGAFGGVSGGGEAGLKYDGVSSALNGFGTGGNQGDGRPAAYLNYILFDQSYKVMNAGWTLMPTSALNNKQQMTLSGISVTEPGYLFVYLSYEDESNQYVQFDDIKVTRTASRVIQSNEYYPFGMMTEASWTREGAKGNNFLYNGGTESNQLTSMYDLAFRNYDPVLGRMAQVDPMADKYGGLSTYNFGFNDPVFWNDPMGADPSNPGFSAEAWAMIMGVWNRFSESDHGGSWSRSEGYNKFDSKEEAAGWIVDNFASIGATEKDALAKAKGMAQGASWVHWKHDFRWQRKNGSNVSFVYAGSGRRTQGGTSLLQLYPDYYQLDARLGESFMRSVVGYFQGLSGKISPDPAGYALLLEAVRHLDPNVDLVDDVSKVKYSTGDPRNRVFNYSWGFNVGTSLHPNMSGGFLYRDPVVYFPIGSPEGTVMNPGNKAPGGSYNTAIKFESSTLGVQWWISVHVYIMLPGG